MLEITSKKKKLSRWDATETDAVENELQFHTPNPKNSQQL
jgi:hypothetical protein